MKNLEKSIAGRVFYYFREICAIPHGSGNVSQISDYLKAFAVQRGLDCTQDESKNVIICKPASPGYEQEEPMILQGHMDMVAVKEPECTLDMEKDPLRLMQDGEWLFAEGTSLGGDDGVAVALSLALLESEDIAHPPLEVVLTVDEETGMDGARSIDLSALKGRRMINLDSEEEGIFLTSCAGGARVDLRLPVQRTRLPEGDMTACVLRVKGLQGGHSGTEIIREGGNANCLLGRILCAMQKAGCEVWIESMSGGNADNAIPRQAEAKVWMAQQRLSLAEQTIWKMQEEIRGELGDKDAGFRAELCRETEEAAAEQRVVIAEAAERMTELLMILPNGVQSMSGNINGLVETSLNLGIMELSDDEFLCGYAVRSSLESARELLCERLEILARLAGADVQIYGVYPGWAYRKESPLREKMCRVYRQMYGREPEIQALHAGVECGLLIGKIPELDCVSIGPDMENVHTTKERLSIPSTERTWEYLLALMADKDKDTD